MKSYTHILSLFNVNGGSTYFPDLYKAKEYVESHYKSVSVELDEKTSTVFVVYQNVLCKDTCEEIYKIMNDSKSIGVSLLSNRIDLFEKYEENYAKIAKLQNSVYKQSAKFNKAKRKLEKAMDELK